MVKEIELFVALIILFIGIVLIFNARHIVKTRFNSNNENLSVNILKVMGFIFSVGALYFTFYIG